MGLRINIVIKNKTQIMSNLKLYSWAFHFKKSNVILFGKVIKPFMNDNFVNLLIKMLQWFTCTLQVLLPKSNL